MRRRVSRVAAIAIAVAGFGWALTLSGTDAPRAGGGNAAWESMKSLQGEWEGLADAKVKTSATYRLVSNGTVLMETLVSPEASEMITMYLRDGAGLVMTHYCSENNQPRLRSAQTADPKRIQFSFVDATNLAAPDAMHMTGLVMTLSNPNHFTQEWTASVMGKQHTSRFEFTRKK